MSFCDSYLHLIPQCPFYSPTIRTQQWEKLLTVNLETLVLLLQLGDFHDFLLDLFSSGLGLVSTTSMKTFLSPLGSLSQCLFICGCCDTLTYPLQQHLLLLLQLCFFSIETVPPTPFPTESFPQTLYSMRAQSQGSLWQTLVICFLSFSLISVMASDTGFGNHTIVYNLQNKCWVPDFAPCGLRRNFLALVFLSQA